MLRDRSGRIFPVWMLILFLFVTATLLNACSDTIDSPKNNDDAGSNTDILDLLDATGDTPEPDDLRDDPTIIDDPVTTDAPPVEPPIGCDLELICADNCCAPDELCLGDKCVKPTSKCQHSNDCPDGWICEDVLGKCIVEPTECIYEPELDIFDPIVIVAWEAIATTPQPTYKQVMMTPAVVDITGDGSPDIIFSTFRDDIYYKDGILRAVNGKTYETIFDLTDAASRVHPGSSIAVGDIDSDGNNEIVAVQADGYGLIAFDDHSTGWSVKWKTEPFRMAEDGPILADLNGDGRVEVVAANRVYDGETGKLLCFNIDVTSQPNQSIAIDLDGDGKLEILAGNGAFKFESDGKGGYNCPTYWMHENGGGFAAVGDFGTFTGGKREFGTRDGVPEVVTVSLEAENQIQLVNGQTGKRIWAKSIPTDGHPLFSRERCISKTGAGPPTIADFAGTGRANIATAGACFYAVFDADGSLMWKMPTQDFSSRNTGSSVFDFQGDGKAEVVYGDECFLRVFDGTGNADGTTNILFEVANTTGTLRELPVVVDVDNDYHADIVVVSNDYINPATGSCHHTWPGFEAKGGASRGVRIVRDRHNRWVTTRPVWNQHAYNVTNVCDGRVDDLCPGRVNKPGAIPTPQVANHSVAHLNNFRQNVQGAATRFFAPDLLITATQSTCSAAEIGHLTVELVVANNGARSVAAGIPVALFTVPTGGTEELLTTLYTTRPLPPGARELLTYVWTDAPNRLGDGQLVAMKAVVNFSGNEENQSLNECNSDNNILMFNALCPCSDNSDCEEGFWCPNSTCMEMPR